MSRRHDDHDDSSPKTRSSSRKRGRHPFEGMLRDPAMRAAVEQAPLVLQSDQSAHRFLWSLLIHEAGANPFRAEGSPMTAQGGLS